ncbi:LysR substrate-binding domain-containing protein [Acidimangrovimonas sediminis]|uniref:LysR substrate-binding domain-containing protein n=2 Tax=Albidovulum sediminis TaxID=3066345 RepID=A0ABT2NTA8_9RHOB|nr:LysR substrate-binding domain-containing protein [Defluviimonas sediminis]
MVMNLSATNVAGQLRQLKPMQLRLLAEIAQAGALGLAAARIGIAQPVASRLLAEMETMLGLRLHERQGRGLRLTQVGEALARRAMRIQIELLDGAREVVEAATGRAGVVRVGAVTGPALSLVLPALRELLGTNPEIHAEVTVTTSVALCELLREGRLDFALARPGAADRELEARLIAGEPLSLVVRRDHPLLLQPRIDEADVMRFDWVMGDDETLLTQTVRARLNELRLPMPRRRISTSSFLFTLALINQTDAIAPLATPVVESFSGNPSVPFVSLPIDLGLTVAAFSLVTRTGSRLTPSAQRLVEEILART